MFLDLRNNQKSSGSSLHKYSVSYSTWKLSFTLRILTTTSARIHWDGMPCAVLGREDSGTIPNNHVTGHYHDFVTFFERFVNDRDELLIDQQWLSDFVAQS